MATVQNIIDSCRYDLRDPAAIAEYTDAELIDYVNRAIRVLDTELASLKSDWTHSTDSPSTLQSGANSVAQPSLCNNIRSVWYGEIEIFKRTTDEIIRKRKWITGTGQSYFYGHEGANIIFERTADQNYELAVHYDTYTDTVVAGTSMPYNGTFNQSILKAVVLIAKSRNELSLSVDAALQELFHEAAMSDVVRRNYRPKRYYLGF